MRTLSPRWHGGRRSQGAELLVNLTYDTWFGQHGGAAPAPPDRGIPSDRESAIPDPLNEFGL